MLLMLHGTGGNENDLLPLGRMLDPDAALLSPRGKVLENGMPRFFRRLAEGVFDLEDLRVRTAELGAFLREAARAYGFEPAQLTAVGHSNGANIAGSLLLSNPEVLGDAVLLRAMVPFEPGPPAGRPLEGHRVLLSEGRQDPYVTAAQVARLVQLFEERGASVTLHEAPGGHGLERGDVETARAWLATSTTPGTG